MPASAKPRRIEKTGIARITEHQGGDSCRSGPGCRRPSWPSGSDHDVGSKAGFCLMNGIRALLTLRSTMPSMAGSRVIAANIVIATMIAEA